MGVEYYYCESCNESIYEEYVGRCTSCDKGLCTDCLINKEDNVEDSIYAYRYGYRFDSEDPELMAEYIAEGIELYKENGEPWYEEDELIDDTSIAPNFCPFCSGDQINDDALLDFIITKYKLDKKAEWKEYKNK